MSKRIVAFFTLAICALFQCSVGCAIPDDERYDDLSEMVVALPPMAQYEAKVEIANRNALDWWRTQLNRYKGAGMALTVVCVDQDTDDPQVTTTLVKIAEVVACLADVPKTTYSGCLGRFEHVMGQKRSLETGKGTTCEAKEVSTFRDARSKHPNWNPRSILTVDVVADLLRSTAPPAWYIAVLAAAGAAGGLPGIPKILVELCAQDVGWGCPVHPLYPGQARPMPDQGAQP
jgi:hypothetical protein